MELKEGMYVRTFEGKIFKIQALKDELIYVSNTECHFYKSLYGGDYCFRFPNENNHYTIIKASHNIIDQIEVGDYVNGYKISDINGNLILLDGWNTILENVEIKSIVTKEQFSAMEYRLGG